MLVHIRKMEQRRIRRQIRHRNRRTTWRAIRRHLGRILSRNLSHIRKVQVLVRHKLAHIHKVQVHHNHKVLVHHIRKVQVRHMLARHILRRSHHQLCQTSLLEGHRLRILSRNLSHIRKVQEHHKQVRNRKVLEQVRRTLARNRMEQELRS